MKNEIKTNVKTAIKNQVLSPFKLIKVVNNIAVSDDAADAEDKKAILAYMSELGVEKLTFDCLLSFNPTEEAQAIFCTLSKIPYEFEELGGANKLAYTKKGVKWYYKRAVLTIPSFIACIGARAKYTTESIYDATAKAAEEERAARKEKKEKERKQKKVAAKKQKKSKK